MPLLGRLTTISYQVLCVLLLGQSTYAFAQEPGWEAVTGADTLRTFMSGLVAERTLPGGGVSRGDYKADGTGVLTAWGSTIPRTWNIKGDDQLCVTAERKTECFKLEKSTSVADRYRVHVIETGTTYEFTVIKGQPVAMGTAADLGDKGGAAAPTAEEIAAQLANPNAPMATMTAKLQFRNFEGTLPNANDQNSTTLLFQPSLPFPLENGDVIIWRPALPVIFDQPLFNGATQEFDAKTGIGDLAFDLAYARTSAAGILTAGGIIASLPIGSSGLTSDQYTLGPEFMIGKLTKQWVLGIFPNHQWGFGGDAGVPDINLTSIQIFGTIIAGGGWTWGTAPTVSYDHNTNQWTVPLNLNIGKTIIAGGRPWKLGAEINYYVDKPDAFGPKWMIGISVAPVVENALAGLFK